MEKVRVQILEKLKKGEIEDKFEKARKDLEEVEKTWEKTPVKIMLDTNIVLAGIIKPNELAYAIIHLLDGKHLENCTSMEALDEL